ncbi:hypothetical protein SFUMM280S_08177 [Streptomyces fumanus]
MKKPTEPRRPEREAYARLLNKLASVLWEVRERFDAPELNLARYIKDGTVTDADNGE